MPLAELDCEICGRRGDVILCINSDWCQQGRCLKCHTSILGQTQYYATTGDIILTCESCVAYGNRSVVKDDAVEALLLKLEGQAGARCTSSTPEKHKRPPPTGDLPKSKRQKPEATATGSSKGRSSAQSPAVSRPSGQDKSSLKKLKPKQPATAAASHGNASTQPMQPQPKQQQPAPAARNAGQPPPLQEQKSTSSRPDPSSSAASKRPAAADQPAAILPVKRPAKGGATDAKHQEAKPKLNQQQLSDKGKPQSAAKKQQQAVPSKRESNAAVPAALSGGRQGHKSAGPDKPQGAGSAQAAAAAALGTMSPTGSQAPSGSGSRLHTLTSSQQQHTQAAAGNKAGIDGKQQAAPAQGTAAAAAALATQAASAKLAQMSGSTASYGTHGKSHDSVQHQPPSKPAAAGRDGNKGPSGHVPSSVFGKITAVDKAAGKAKAAAVGHTATEEASKRLRSAGSGSQRPGAAQQRLLTPQGSLQSGEQRVSQQGGSHQHNKQQSGQTVGIKPVDKEAVRRRAEERMRPSASLASAPKAPGSVPAAAEPKQAAMKPKVKPFSLAGVKVTSQVSEETDEENNRDSPEQQPEPIQTQDSLRPSRSTPPRRVAPAQSKDGWTGHATIEIGDTDVVEIDVRIVPCSGVSLPPLVQSLKSAEDTQVEGSLVIKARMDDRARREYGQGGVQPSANFAKSLVILRERAFGQEKQLQGIISQMVEGKKYLRLYCGSQSVFFAPILRPSLAEANGLDLVDYAAVVFDKADNPFEQVFDDQLALVYYLKPGEELPSCRSVQFVESDLGAGGGGSGWNKHQAAPKSNLKKANMQPESHTTLHQAPLAVAVSAPTNFGGTHLQDDPDEDWWGDEPMFNAGDVDRGSGGLGMGMGMPSAAGDVGFMASEDAHVTSVGFSGAISLEAAGPSANHRANGLSTGGGAAYTNDYAAKLSPYEVVQTVAQPAASVPSSLVGFCAQPVAVLGVAHGTSPPTPDQELPPTPPVIGLQRQPSYVGQSLMNSNMLRHAKKPKLMPSYDGLCGWFGRKRMARLKVHIDGTLVDHDSEKAHALEAWMSNEGATVTMLPADCIPGPNDVNLLVVHGQSIADKGMEGGSMTFAINRYLLEGVHVVTEAFIEELQRCNLQVTPESLWSLDKERKHWQFFAKGVSLMLDKTLLKYSSGSQLAHLMKALQNVASNLGHPPSEMRTSYYKAFVRQQDYMEAIHVHADLRLWREKGVVVDLPTDYQSTSQNRLPQSNKDAIKAVYNINRSREALRYMVVVVPDASDLMAGEDFNQVETMLKAALEQKTVFTATLTDVMSFLSLLSTR